MKSLEWFLNTDDDKFILGSPDPSSSNIPSWYKSLTRFFDRDNNPTESLTMDKPHGARLTIKTCMPFLDSLTSGYLLKLWCDINIRHEEAGPVIEWASVVDPLVVRDSGTVLDTPVLDGFLPMTTVWFCPWGFKTPPGYSLLITHPFNRWDLPFITSSGIVDSDSFYAPGNIPFSLSRNFTGVIKQGTPIAQIIPIKRESWQAVSNQSIQTEGNLKATKLRNFLYGGYKAVMWHKKQYK